MGVHVSHSLHQIPGVGVVLMVLADTTVSEFVAERNGKSKLGVPSSSLELGAER